MKTPQTSLTLHYCHNLHALVRSRRRGSENQSPIFRGLKLTKLLGPLLPPFRGATPSPTESCRAPRPTGTARLGLRLQARVTRSVAWRGVARSQRKSFTPRAAPALRLPPGRTGRPGRERNAGIIMGGKNCGPRRRAAAPRSRKWRGCSRVRQSWRGQRPPTVTRPGAQLVPERLQKERGRRGRSTRQLGG